MGTLWKPTYRYLGEVRESSIWWIQFYRHGERIAESAKTRSKKEAERLLKRREGEVVTGMSVGPEKLRVSDLLDLLLEDYRLQDHKSLVITEQRLEKHVRPRVGDIRAARFGSSNVKRYIADRRGAEPATINRELAIIRRAFALAIQHDPPLVARAPFIMSLTERNVRTGFVEHNQYKAICHELPDDIRPLLVVGYHVGNRKGELLMLQWTQVDLIHNEIRLNAGETKNDAGRVLPIYGDMIGELSIRQTQALQIGCPWVFHREGKRVQRFEKSWASACERAGCPGLLFHDLRRSAVRNMVRAGIPEQVAMKISGHKTRAIFGRYDIVSGRDLKTAAAKMEVYLDAQPSKKPSKTSDNEVSNVN